MPWCFLPNLKLSQASTFMQLYFVKCSFYHLRFLPSYFFKLHVDNHQCVRFVHAFPLIYFSSAVEFSLETRNFSTKFQFSISVPFMSVNSWIRLWHNNFPGSGSVSTPIVFLRIGLLSKSLFILGRCFSVDETQIRTFFFPGRWVKWNSSHQ